MRCASMPSLPLATVQRLDRLDRELEEERETERLAVGRSLDALLEAAKSRALIGALLIEAKQVLYGQFEDWLVTTHSIHPRTAQRYMAFAREFEARSLKYDTSVAFDDETTMRLLLALVREEQEKRQLDARDPVKLLLAFTDSIEKRFEREKVSALPTEVKAQLRAKLEKLLEGLR
jgi:hypothetical protein